MVGIATLGSIVTIITGMTYLDGIKNFFRSDHSKYESENFEPGQLRPKPLDTLIPDSILLVNEPKSRRYVDTSSPPPIVKGILLGDQNGDIIFDYGSNNVVVPRRLLDTGFNVSRQAGGGCSGIDVILGIKDNRLYVSTIFNSILNSETIGIIEFNRWKLFRPNVLDWKNDDERLEVRDRQNNIVFTIKYVGGNHVTIRGYFIGPKGVSVVNNGDDAEDRGNNCFPYGTPNWKEAATQRISMIKSNF